MTQERRQDQQLGLEAEGPTFFESVLTGIANWAAGEFGSGYSSDPKTRVAIIDPDSLVRCNVVIRRDGRRSMEFSGRVEGLPQGAVLEMCEEEGELFFTLVQGGQRDINVGSRLRNSVQSLAVQFLSKPGLTLAIRQQGGPSETVEVLGGQSLGARFAGQKFLSGEETPLRPGKTLDLSRWQKTLAEILPGVEIKAADDGWTVCRQGEKIVFSPPADEPDQQSSVMTCKHEDNRQIELHFWRRSLREPPSLTTIVFKMAQGKLVFNMDSPGFGAIMQVYLDNVTNPSLVIKKAATELEVISPAKLFSGILTFDLGKMEGRYLFGDGTRFYLKNRCQRMSLSGIYRDQPEACFAVRDGRLSLTINFKTENAPQLLGVKVELGLEDLARGNILQRALFEPLALEKRVVVFPNPPQLS